MGHISALIGMNNDGSLQEMFGRSKDEDFIGEYLEKLAFYDGSQGDFDIYLKKLITDNQDDCIALEQIATSISMLYDIFGRNLMNDKQENSIYETYCNYLGYARNYIYNFVSNKPFARKFYSDLD